VKGKTGLVIRFMLVLGALFAAQTVFLFTYQLYESRNAFLRFEDDLVIKARAALKNQRRSLLSDFAARKKYFESLLGERYEFGVEWGIAKNKLTSPDISDDEGRRHIGRVKRDLSPMTFQVQRGWFSGTLVFLVPESRLAVARAIHTASYRRDYIDQAFQSGSWIIAFAVFSLVLFALVFFFIYRHLLSLLGGMEETIEKIKAGRLQSRLSPGSHVFFTGLADSFNDMVYTMAMRIRALKDERMPPRSSDVFETLSESGLDRKTISLGSAGSVLIRVGGHAENTVLLLEGSNGELRSGGYFRDNAEWPEILLSQKLLGDKITTAGSGSDLASLPEGFSFLFRAGIPPPGKRASLSGKLRGMGFFTIYFPGREKAEDGEAGEERPFQFEIEEIPFVIFVSAAPPWEGLGAQLDLCFQTILNNRNVSSPDRKPLLKLTDRLFEERNGYSLLFCIPESSTFG